MALRIRRGTDAERQSVTFASGEIVYTTDTKALYVGDGTTVGGKFLTSGVARLGDIDLNGNDITGIGNIDITGNIHATGNITADGNITIGDANTDNVSFNADINSDLLPNTDVTFDLGSTVDNKRWNTLHVNVVEATTVKGSFEGDLDGDVKGSVFGEDSTPLVDAIANKLTGPIENSNSAVFTGTVNMTGATVTGNLTGDVTGNLTGNVTGDVTGNLTGNILDSQGRTIVDIGANLQADGQTLFTGIFLGDMRGSISGDDSTTLIDSTESTINLDGTVAGRIVPKNDNFDSIGSFDKRYTGIHLSEKIYIGTYDNVNVRVEQANSADRLVVKGGAYGRLPLPTTLSASLISGTLDRVTVFDDTGIQPGAIFRLPGTGELVVASVGSGVIITTTTFEVSVGETGTQINDFVVFYNPPQAVAHYATAAPADSKGQQGDHPGLVYADSSFTYICKGFWDGVTNIWTRSAGTDSF